MTWHSIIKQASITGALLASPTFSKTIALNAKIHHLASKILYYNQESHKTPLPTLESQKFTKAGFIEDSLASENLSVKLKVVLFNLRNELEKKRPNKTNINNLEQKMLAIHKKEEKKAFAKTQKIQTPTGVEESPHLVAKLTTIESYDFQRLFESIKNYIKENNFEILSESQKPILDNLMIELAKAKPDRTIVGNFLELLTKLGRESLLESPIQKSSPKEIVTLKIFPSLPEEEDLLSIRIEAEDSAEKSIIKKEAPAFLAELKATFAKHEAIDRPAAISKVPVPTKIEVGESLKKNSIKKEAPAFLAELKTTFAKQEALNRPTISKAPISNKKEVALSDKEELQMELKSVLSKKDLSKVLKKNNLRPIHQKDPLTKIKEFIHTAPTYQQFAQNKAFFSLRTEVLDAKNINSAQVNKLLTDLGEESLHLPLKENINQNQITKL